MTLSGCEKKKQGNLRNHAFKLHGPVHPRQRRPDRPPGGRRGQAVGRDRLAGRAGRGRRGGLRVRLDHHAVQGPADGAGHQLPGLGLGLMFFSAWMDWLDEFVHVASDAVWDNVLESGPLPFGTGLHHAGPVPLAPRAAGHQRADGKARGPLPRPSPVRQPDPAGARRLPARPARAGAGQGARRPPAAFAGGGGHRELQRHQPALRHGRGRRRAAGPEPAAGAQPAPAGPALPAGGRPLRGAAAQYRRGAGPGRVAGELRDAVRHLAHHTRDHGERLHLHAAVAAVMAVSESADDLLARLNGAFLTGDAALPVAA